MARFSSSRYFMYRRVWVPGSREEPFFPLRRSRSSATTRPENPPGLPTARVSECVPNGIILAPSPRSALRLPATCFGNFRTVPIAGCRRPTLHRYFDLVDASLGMDELRRLPRIVPRFDVAESLQSHAAPVGESIAGPQSALAPSAVLVAEHLQATLLAPTHHVRAQPPNLTVVHRRDRPPPQDRYSYEVVNLFPRLIRTGHDTRIPRSITRLSRSMAILYDTVVLGSPRC